MLVAAVSGALLAAPAAGAASFSRSAPGHTTSATRALAPDVASAPVAGAQGPQIAGSPVIGGSLSVTSNGDWTADPAPTYTYQWYSCQAGSCSAINGATSSSYTPTIFQSGDQVEVSVTATNASGQASAFSNVLGPVASGAVPRELQPPSILGIGVVGVPSQAFPGNWELLGGPPAYADQWLRCPGPTSTAGTAAPAGCVAIAGATESLYTPAPADVGSYLAVAVTASSAGGSVTAYSATEGPVGLTTKSVEAALASITHPPTSSKAIKTFAKAGSIAISFTAPSGGSANITWTATITTGKGKHKRRHKVTVATGATTAAGLGAVPVTMHLTTTARRLLKLNPHPVELTATEQFTPTGGQMTSVTRRFPL
jgi:hypothetical protein